MGIGRQHVPPAPTSSSAVPTAVTRRERGKLRQRQCDLVAASMPRTQAREGILRHECDPATADQPPLSLRAVQSNGFAADRQRSPCRHAVGEEARECLCRHRLAAARLSDDRDRLPGPELESEVLHDRTMGACNGEPGDRQRGCAHRRSVFPARRSSSQSPTTFTAAAVSTIMIPGANAAAALLASSACPSES